MLPLPPVLFFLVAYSLTGGGRCEEETGGSRITQSQHTEGITALLLESLRNQRAQACEGQRVVLRCPPHTLITVEKTFYGRLVPSEELCGLTEKQLKKREKKDGEGRAKAPVWEDKYEDTSCDVKNAKSKIVEKCGNRRKCKIRVKPQFFGRDPCPTTSKYLQISYKCQPSEFHSHYACEGSEMQLKCRTKKLRLALHSAVYGRTVESQADSCPANNTLSYDCTVDVLRRVVGVCHAQNKCSLDVNEKGLGNPCPFGTNKYLYLVYMCVNGNVFSEKAMKGELVEEYSDDGGPVMIAPPMPPPRPPTTPTPPLNNDAAYEPILTPPIAKREPDMEARTESPWMGTRTPPPTCLPSSIPNAMGFLQNWIETYNYLRANKEKLILYFCVSASGGLIILLALCIAQQCWRRVGGTGRAEESEATERLTTSDLRESKYDMHTHTPATMYDTESRMDMTEFGRNGVSFMRFNHPTPPRVQTLPSQSHHYYG